MRSKNWAGIECKLVNKAGEEMQRNQQFENDEGDGVLLLEGGTAPHKPSSSGRVYVSGGEYFPHVFGFKWVEVTA